MGNLIAGLFTILFFGGIIGVLAFAFVKAFQSKEQWRPLSKNQSDSIQQNDALEWSLANDGIISSYGDLSSPFDN